MILALLLWAQDPIAVEASVAGGEKFIVKGTTDLPDGALLRVEIYYHHAAPGRRVARNRAVVADGKFECACEPRGISILDGRYAACVRADENQPADFPRAYLTELHRYAVSIGFQKGTDEEALRAVRVLRERLASEIRAASDAVRKARGNAAAMRRTLADIQRRVIETREYAVAGLNLFGENVFDDLACVGEGIAKAPADRVAVLTADLDNIAHAYLTALGVSDGGAAGAGAPLRKLKALVENADADPGELAACLLDAAWAEPRLASPLQDVRAALDAGDRPKALKLLQGLMGD